MLSYVYMKILESQPERYDRGIALLSLGASERAKRGLVERVVRPGAAVLEIGCGTGTLAVLAARKGARVTGLDISAAMLRVAARKVGAAGLADRVTLAERGVSSLDRLADESFDVVLSTLVFSELSPDEQDYALRHAFRVLRPGGRLALADEARPRTWAKRLLHGLLRLPLALVTFLLTQTTTRAVSGLRARVARAGFRVVSEQRSRLDDFLVLVAVKGDSR